MRDDFCIFILTHGRADRVVTLRSLERAGYTGKVYLVIDDEDKTADEYRKRYGEMVLQFSKAEIEKTFDTFDNFGKRNTITHARNACFELAKQVGCTYFMELDDDYTRFSYMFDDEMRYADHEIKSLDSIISLMIDFYKSTLLLSLAFCQGGDHIGGQHGTYAKSISIKRKCMNSFLCSIDRPFKFRGTMNEDVNTYTFLGFCGNFFATLLQLKLIQKETQSQSGGITELYQDFGTYVKSFYTVMAQPSSVIVNILAESCDLRLHHRIDWEKTTPKIIRESHKKQ